MLINNHQCGSKKNMGNLRFPGHMEMTGSILSAVIDSGRSSDVHRGLDRSPWPSTPCIFAIEWSQISGQTPA